MDPNLPNPQHWTRDIVALLARQDLDRAAECQVLKEKLAEFISASSGRDVSAELSDLESAVKQRQEKYLFQIETANPFLAALLDKGRPPIT